MTDEINLDTCTAIAFVAEGSPVRATLRAAAHGNSLVMTDTAIGEFGVIVVASAGPRERARAARFLARVRAIPDGPSARAMALRPTRSLEPPDIVIYRPTS